MARIRWTLAGQSLAVQQDVRLLGNLSGGWGAPALAVPRPATMTTARYTALRHVHPRFPRSDSYFASQTLDSSAESRSEWSMEPPSQSLSARLIITVIWLPFSRVTRLRCAGGWQQCFSAGYACFVRYAYGGGLTAEGRARRETVRLRAAEMFAQDADPVQIASSLRVSTKSVYQWRRVCRGGGREDLASKGRAGARTGWMKVSSRAARRAEGRPGRTRLGPGPG